MGYFNCNLILATMWQSLTTRGKALLETMVATIYGRIAYPPLLGTHILRNETHYMRIPTPDSGQAYSNHEACFVVYMLRVNSEIYRYILINFDTCNVRLVLYYEQRVIIQIPVGY